MKKKQSNSPIPCKFYFENQSKNSWRSVELFWKYLGNHLTKPDFKKTAFKNTLQFTAFEVLRNYYSDRLEISRRYSGDALEFNKPKTIFIKSLNYHCFERLKIFININIKLQLPAIWENSDFRIKYVVFFLTRLLLPEQREDRNIIFFYNRFLNSKIIQ